MDCLYCHSQYVDNPVRPGRCGSCGASKPEQEKEFDESTINWEEYLILSTIDSYIYKITKNKEVIATIELTSKDIEAIVISGENPNRYISRHSKKIIIDILKGIPHETKPKLEAMADKHHSLRRH